MGKCEAVSNMEGAGRGTRGRKEGRTERERGKDRKKERGREREGAYLRYRSL